MNRFIALTIASVLTASTAAESAPRQADAPEQPSDPNEKVVCKSFTRIGTLAGRYRTCKTKGEWQRERDNLRQVNVSDSCSTRYNGGPGSPAPNSGSWDC